MSFTVNDVIRDARDRHPALHEKFTPAILGRRWISQAQRRLMSRAVEADSHYAAARLTVDLSTDVLILAAITTGIPLPARLRVLGATLRYTDPVDDEPITVTTYANRIGRHAVRSVYLLGDSLYLMGDVLEWMGATSLFVDYSPMPADLASDGDVLLLTDAAREVVAAGLAAFWGGRMIGKGLTAAELKILGDAAVQAEESFIRTITQPGRARVLMIRGMGE